MTKKKAAAGSDGGRDTLETLPGFFRRMAPAKKQQGLVVKGLHPQAQPVDPRSPPADMKATWQDPLGVTPPVHAFLHHLPDPQQPGFHFSRPPPGGFISQDDLPNEGIFLQAVPH